MELGVSEHPPILLESRDDISEKKVIDLESPDLSLEPPGQKQSAPDGDAVQRDYDSLSAFHPMRR